MTSWNEGEEFASMGIGHFIWYPSTEKVVYEESFPRLVLFMSENGVDIPRWIIKGNKIHMPWRDRGEFLLDYNSQRMIDLRKFLFDTMNYQVLFMINRLESALTKILKATKFSKRLKVKRQFYRLYDLQYGAYVLIDYTNFKGEGILDSESYNGYGWGLRQVLENMEDNGKGNEINDFVESAKFVLTRRVLNSPSERNEERWLEGWLKRVENYNNFVVVNENNN